jgi:hypothetical protein
MPVLMREAGDAGGIFLLRALSNPFANVVAFTAALRTVIDMPPVWGPPSESL